MPLLPSNHPRLNRHTLSRRNFLTGTASLAAATALAGCTSQKVVLDIRLLNGSLPPQIVGELRKRLRQTAQAALNVSLETRLDALFTALQSWQQQASPSPSGLLGRLPFVRKAPSKAPGLMTLGHFWLDKAIQQGLVQPLPQPPEWDHLPSKWQSVGVRSTPSAGSDRIWAAPYRWGTTMIAYRKDIFQERGLPLPTDWTDLWRSDLQRRVSLLDQPREVIGLTLKKLGQSYNTTNPNAITNLATELAALNQQAKLYSSNAYLQPLLLGDTWLAVGWSTDILPLLQRSRTLGAVVPQSGTALWADLWVRPTRAADLPASLLTDWLSLCWQPDIATQLSLLSWAASPIVVTMPSANLPPLLRSNSLLLPDAKILAASEFIQPLDRPTEERYQALWEQMRRAG